jgi:hypothetical protein
MGGGKAGKKPEAEAAPEGNRRTNRPPAKNVTPPDQLERANKPGTTHISPQGSKHIDH